jgi:hypothetical protein
MIIFKFFKLFISQIHMQYEQTKKYININIFINFQDFVVVVDKSFILKNRIKIYPFYSKKMLFNYFSFFLFCLETCFLL